MTGDHPVRRVLARFCSPATMARVVDPTLADTRFEDGRLTWRGCVTLARVLVLHAMIEAPGTLAQVFSDDEGAIPRIITSPIVAPSAGTGSSVSGSRTSSASRTG